MSCFNHIDCVAKVLVSMVMVTGVVGNLLVIIVILKVNDMLNSTNIFLANLAVADILVLLLSGNRNNCIYIFDWLLRTSGGNAGMDLAPWLLFWIMHPNIGVLTGAFIIGFIQIRVATFTMNPVDVFAFLMTTVVNASVLTVLAIGFERYYAICQPLKAGVICTRRRALRLCILAWTLATALSSPILLPNSVWSNGWDDYFFFTNDTIVFIVPPVVLTVLFIIISRHLNAADGDGVNTAAFRHRRHVITMLATVVFCFFIFQLPYRVFQVSIYFWPTTFNDWVGDGEYFSKSRISFLLLYLHSAVNPILYSFMSTRFRAGFKETCCLWKPK